MTAARAIWGAMVLAWCAGAAPSVGVAQDQCAALLDARCLQTLGAGSTAAPSGECEAQMAAYRDCLAGLAAAAPGGRAASGERCTDATALTLWEDAKAENDCLGYQTFVDACPAAPQARFASARLKRLGCDGAASTASVPVSQPAPAPQPAVDPTALYRDSQTELKRLGLYTAGIDGDWGPGSQRAMRAFQQKAGLPVDGQASERALSVLRGAAREDFAPAAPQPAAGKTPWIGLKIQDLTEETARRLGASLPIGAVVVDFAPDSPARKAGLRKDDIVMSVDGGAVSRARDVARLVAARRTGDRVPVMVFRNRQSRTLWVTIGAAP